MEVVASLSQGRTAAAQCGLFTHKSVAVIFEPPCISSILSIGLPTDCIGRDQERSSIILAQALNLGVRLFRSTAVGTDVST